MKTREQILDRIKTTKFLLLGVKITNNPNKIALIGQLKCMEWMLEDAD